MADPTVIDCASACTVTVVHQMALPPLQLTREEGGLIAGAILLCWTAAWAIRMVARVLMHTDEGPREET